MLTARELARFMSKVVMVGDCWTWTGATNNAGYGLFRFRGKTVTTHRLSYQHHVGEIPESDGYHGTCVLHRCDVRNCVNPAHLFLGSNAENIEDMHAKGRARKCSPKGERHGMAKLTSADVLAIVAAVGQGRSKTSVARDFHVTPSMVGRITKGRAWTHVTGLNPIQRTNQERRTKENEHAA